MADKSIFHKESRRRSCGGTKRTLLFPEEVVWESNHQSVRSLLKRESWEGAVFAELTGAPAVLEWLLCIPVLVLKS